MEFLTVIYRAVRGPYRFWRDLSDCAEFCLMKPDFEWVFEQALWVGSGEEGCGGFLSDL